MGRIGLGLVGAAIVIATSAPAMAQRQAPVPARDPAPAVGEKAWNLVLTFRPDQARKAADDVVAMIRNPSGKTPPILSDMLGILSVRVSVDDGRSGAGKPSKPDSLAQRMATAGCEAAVTALGRQAAIVREGYGAAAAGLPADRVAELRQQVQSLAGQLAGATKSAIDYVRKDSAPAAKR